MKRCPQCNTDYFDELIEFCLDDGERLLQFSNSDVEKETIQSFKTINEKTEAETFVLGETQLKDKIVSGDNKESNLQEKITEKSDKIRKSAKVKWHAFLEYFPIFLALTHNYWQWLYLVNLKKPKISDFLTSNIFLSWILLLLLGIAFGIISLKFSKRKGLAIVSLIILAINLILSIVPK